MLHSIPDFQSVRTSFALSDKTKHTLKELAKKFQGTQKETLDWICLKMADAELDWAGRGTEEVGKTVKRSTVVTTSRALKLIESESTRRRVARDLVLETWISEYERVVDWERKQEAELYGWFNQQLGFVLEEAQELEEETKEKAGPEHPLSKRATIVTVIIERLEDEVSGFLNGGDAVQPTEWWG